MSDKPCQAALVTPFAPPSPRGNAITSGRIARGLGGRGVDVRLWDLSAMPEGRVEAELLAARPALIHAFHAFTAGPVASRAARRLDVPLVVTLTGTDVNHDLAAPDRSAAVRQALEAAAAITVFHPSIGARVAEALPRLADRVVEIPQAASFEGTDAFALDGDWVPPPPRALFLLPAGIRQVKRPALALEGVDAIRAARPWVRLAFAGPVVEADQGEALRRALASRPWARHLGALPHTRMASLLGQADMVLNCSLSEGGMANAVLEALALGRAVLASAIDGNRSLIEHGVTGLLFENTVDFAVQAARLADDPDLRARLGQAGRARVERDFPPAREIDGYVSLYRRLAGFAPTIEP